MILWQSGCEAEGKERRAAERQADEEAKNVFTFKNVSEGSFKKEKDMIEEVIELKVEAHDKCINGDEIEAIQDIFFRVLDSKNVARHLIFLEANKEKAVKENNTFYNLHAKQHILLFIIWRRV